jgi:hypothetical protein
MDSCANSCTKASICVALRRPTAWRRPFAVDDWVATASNEDESVTSTAAASGSAHNGLIFMFKQIGNERFFKKWYIESLI